MPTIESDIVDAYVFRRVNDRVQFLLLYRRPDMPMGNTWQGVHGRIAEGESAVDAAARQIQTCTGLKPEILYSADFIGQFYDHQTDSILLAPTFAAQVSPHSSLNHSGDFIDYAWCDLEESTARLMLTNQRWAIRHIYDVIALGGEEADLYRV